MTWCANFKKAVEEETIKLIDEYQDCEIGGDWYKNKTKIKKGFYIIDQYKDGELALEDHPAYPMVPLKYCPYCGATITMEDI
jgi:hypothetical protein